MAKKSAGRRWAMNLLKLLITVGGFYLLLTHEVSTWVRTSTGAYSVPVTEQVESVVIQGKELARLDAGTSFSSDTIGWTLHDELLTLRLADGMNPQNTGFTLSSHEEVGEMRIATAIADYVSKVDAKTFLLWSLIAMAIKFIGVLSSAMAWNLLLRGQGLRFPFWQQIVTSFLIGRFIGTFLPSTIGLDGYTLFEAGRYSNEWTRATTAKALEKFIGIAGLFAGLILTLPAGYVVLTDVVGSKAPILTAAIGVVCISITVGVVGGLVAPQRYVAIYNAVEARLPTSLQRIKIVRRFVDAATAYQGKIGIVMGALMLKFVTHFTTAMVYFFTALAIGVVGVSFLPIVFGSLIQILGTLFSPTIAGEGAREAIQALLLSNYLGGAAQAVLSAALGFVAAEAATLWGGAFLWTRTAKWRPSFMLVDGKQVSYEWLSDDDDGVFDADVMERMRNASPQ